MPIETSGDELPDRSKTSGAAFAPKSLPRCPDGNPQRLRRPVAFRERGLGELELRVPMSQDEHGACQVVVDELEDAVYVRVCVCHDDTYPRDRVYCDCPVRVWLDRPLGDRAVIDQDGERALPRYVPK
jgi:hypothetical protein